MQSILARTLLWFQKAVPEPTSKNFHTQLGVHLEEVGEMLDSLRETNDITLDLVLQARRALEALATHLKQTDNAVVVHNRIDFLDSICDQIVTAAGVAHMHGDDILGAMREVNRSNFSKFDPDTGEPILDPVTRKVLKGPNFSKPSLARFLGRREWFR